MRNSFSNLSFGKIEETYDRYLDVSNEMIHDDVSL